MSNHVDYYNHAYRFINKDGSRGELKECVLYKLSHLALEMYNDNEDRCDEDFTSAYPTVDDYIDRHRVYRHLYENCPNNITAEDEEGIANAIHCALSDHCDFDDVAKVKVNLHGQYGVEIDLLTEDDLDEEEEDGQQAA